MRIAARKKSRTEKRLVLLHAWNIETALQEEKVKRNLHN